MTSSCTLPGKLWRTSHEPRADSRRVQHQDSLIGENLVRSSMGPVRTTDSRLRVLMSKLVSTAVPNYLFFYAVGLMVITVFDSGADVGRHFVEHAHEGELPYFLSLPVSRGGFLAAQAIYGVANTMIKVLPPLIGVLWFVGDLTIQGAVFALIS